MIQDLLAQHKTVRALMAALQQETGMPVTKEEVKAAVGQLVTNGKAAWGSGGSISLIGR